MNCAQDKSYSMEELQTMLSEMAQGFETSSWYCTPSILEEPRNSKRARYDGQGKFAFQSFGLGSVWLWLRDQHCLAERAALFLLKSQTFF
jgi:hypothetical protein